MFRWNWRLRLMSWLAGVLALVFLGCMPAVESGHEEGPPHQLTGKAAPLFSTTYLDGQPFELADHLGKDILILDFWATWCPPCVASMPVLSEVSSEFRDRGVRLLAVNCAEEAEAVKDFVEQSGLELTVVMDPDGQITKDYGAEGIPQTVLIDRQGKVRFVHVGSQNLREWLSKNLTVLVGESSAPPGADATAAAH